MTLHAPPPRFSRQANDWLDRVFRASATETGGVIRRQIADIDREVGRARFEAEVRMRGFQLIRTRRYYIVVCDQGPIDLII